jgi:hypothetical protein
MLPVRLGLREDYASFPGVVAGQPTPAPRDSSPGIRASLLTRAKFFRHEHSCRSPRGDTQLLRFSVILVSTFYPSGHCYAQARGWSNDPVDAGCSIVVSDPRSHNWRCGVDLTTVSAAPPFPRSSVQNPSFCAFNRSPERRGGTKAPWAQRPSERPVLLGCGCLEGGVANTHGDHAIALRGVILTHPSRRFVRLMLLPIDSYFS